MQACRGLFLYTEEDAAVRLSQQRLRQFLKDGPAVIREVPFVKGSRGTLYRQFAALLRQHLPPDLTPDQLVFDLTPGTKPMSLSLAELAPAGSWLLYLEHALLEDARAEPGSEAFDRWQVERTAQATDANEVGFPCVRR